VKLVGAGTKIWIDNMFIDQSSYTDVTAQVAVMGDIYGNAQCVSVLLPPSEGEACEKIVELLSIAKTLLEQKGQFDYNSDDET
jgi:hypothetical protein